VQFITLRWQPNFNRSRSLGFWEKNDCHMLFVTMSNRRNPHPRYQMSHQASLLVGDQGCRVFCTIKDMSVTGARLGSVPLKALPENISISIPHEDVLLPCRMRWVEGTEVGVEFTGTPEFLTNRFDREAETAWAEIHFKMPSSQKL
jgi:hypothetical protein